MTKINLFTAKWIFPVLVISQLSLAGQATNRNNIEPGKTGFSRDKSVELFHNTDSREVNNDSLWMHYDDVELFDAWGFMISGELYDVMAKWDPAQLTGYQDWTITKVKFIIVHDLPIIKVKVWQGANGTQIYTQDVPDYNVNTWTEVILDVPVDFDHTQELYVGYEVDMTMTELGGAVTAIDDGPPVDGYGNLYRWNGSWYSDFNNHNLRVMLELEFAAAFTASPTTVCEGSTVTFSDASLGTVTGWEWTFEGGTPSTSTAQNPVVTYNTPGEYDVTLVVSNGTSQDTLTVSDYITVVGPVLQPPAPTGETDVCSSFSTTYTTSSVQYASSYNWQVTPSAAGTITGNDTMVVFQSSYPWTGAYTIKVRASNECGYGPWSDELSCELWPIPIMYELEGEGAFCSGSQGAEIGLDNSQTGVDYELYKNGNPTSIIVAGTGSPISFGYISEEGVYACVGYTEHCQEFMLGDIYVHEVFPPAQPATPSGPGSTCNNETDTYTTEPDPDASSYTWTLTPPEAGTLVPNNESVEIMWNTEFFGDASLVVQTGNDCGDSPESGELNITVNESPAPVISGEQVTCDNEEEIYSTLNNPGSTYTWEISGGNITAGSGTSEITVLWGEPGEGWVKVEEENADGCSAITDEFIVTIDECTGTPEGEQNMIRLFPNPVTSALKIQWNANTTAIREIRIINTYGAIVQTITTNKMNGATVEVNTAVYPDGIYFIQLLTEEKTIINGKFIVMH